MTFHSIFYLPPLSPSASDSSNAQTPLQLVLGALAKAYTLRPVPQQWSLSHRLLRSTPIPSDPSSPNPQARTRALQILVLPHVTPETYVAASFAAPNTEPDGQSSNTNSKASPITRLVTLPANAAISSKDIYSNPEQSSQRNATDDFLTLVITKMAPLWQPRQALVLQNGQVFEIGEAARDPDDTPSAAQSFKPTFRIWLGELRQIGGGAAPAPSSGPGDPPGPSPLTARGVLCEVEWLGEDEDDGEPGASDDYDIGEQIIAEFWEAVMDAGLKQSWKTSSDGATGIKRFSWPREVDTQEEGVVKAGRSERENRRARMWLDVLRLRG